MTHTIVLGIIDIVDILVLLVLLVLLDKLRIPRIPTIPLNIVPHLGIVDFYSEAFSLKRALDTPKSKFSH